MDELRQRRVSLYLTSIGYDGESIDNVTGLPKPKLHVEAGDIVATAEKCLTVSTARFEVLAHTEVRTPLGKIKVIHIKEAGLVVTAGPNKSSEVRIIAEILNRLGPGITLVDGALNRIMPMSETDGFILATGVARSLDIPHLARETECIRCLAALPLLPIAATIEAQNLKNVSLLGSDGWLLAEAPFASLLSNDDTNTALKAAAETSATYLFVPGIIGERAMKQLTQEHSYLPRFLVLTHPIKLLAIGNAIEYYERIEQLTAAGVVTGVLQRIPLMAVTVNPFYPEFRYETASYQPAFVDPVRLQLTVQNAVNVPVYNIVRQGAGQLVDLILNSRKTWLSPQTVDM